MRHFNDELALKFALERAEVVDGPATRVEVLGSIRQGSQLRKVRVSAFPGESRHLVVIFSAPSGRFDALAPVITESLDSVRGEGPTTAAPRAAAWAVLALIGSLLATSVGLWRRRLLTRQ